MNAWDVGLVGLFFLVLFGVGIPILAYRARDRLTRMQPRPTRRQLYVSTLMQLVFFLALGLLTAWREGLELWRWPERYALPLVASVVLLAAMVFGTRSIKRAAVRRREPRVYFTMPQGPLEIALWIAVAVMAGVAEEYVYRGVFTDLVGRLTGSLGLAWGLAVAAFTIAHANQGVGSMAVIASFALVAHVLVFLTGTLLFAIVLHAAYDVIAGFEYTRLGRQLGYPVHGLPDAAPDGDVTTSPAASSQ